MSKTYFNISDKLRLYEFDGMLDQYGDAAAAYSLRKLRNGYTGNAIRVRRSSDNTERDMGFYNNELDTVALLDWVNADHIKYESDFRLGGDNFSTLELQQLNGESIAGEDNAAKFTLTGGLNSHYAYRGPTTIGQTMKVTGRYYIPSTNASCNAIRISGGSSEFIFANTLDEWAEFEHITTATVSYAIFRAANGENTDFDGDGDVFYLKDLVYTQITADGHVHTWYDQSANANHAVQGTDTAQPKIIDAGALVEEDGKAAVLFGTPTFMQTATGLPLSSEDSLISVLYKHDNLNNANVFDSQINNKFFLQYDDAAGYRFDNDTQYDLSQTGISSRVLATLDFNSTQLKSYFNGTNTSTQTVNSVSHTGLTLGRHRTTTINYLGGTMQEFVYWNTNNTNNSLAIQENINTHYNIY